jgi:NAD(P)H-dependent FMN reductase
VVHIPVVDAPVVNVVNVDLDAFRECVAAVIARFPFYGEDDEPEQYEEVAEELRRTISEIDKSALGYNGL